MRRMTKIMFLVLLVSSFQAKAYLTIGESTDLVPVNLTKVGGEAQFRMSDGGGVNLDAFIGKAFQDDMSWKIQLGGGDTDIQATGSYKWIPIPDFGEQPAVGLYADVSLGRDNDQSFWVLRASPMVGKQFEIQGGKITPYAALPVGIVSANSNTQNFVQLVLGTDYTSSQIDKLTFNAELGSNVNKAFSYLSIGCTYWLDKSEYKTRSKK